MLIKPTSSSAIAERPRDALDPFPSYNADNRCLSSVIFHELCCEFGLVLVTQNHIVHMVNVFIRVGTSRSVAALTYVYCVRVSELLQQPVNATWRPSFVWKFCSQLFRIMSLQLI